MDKDQFKALEGVVRRLDSILEDGGLKYPKHNVLLHPEQGGAMFPLDDETAQAVDRLSSETIIGFHGELTGVAKHLDYDYELPRDLFYKDQ